MWKIIVPLAIIFAYTVIVEVNAVGFRKFPASSSGSSASGTCSTETRLATLNCSCALGVGARIERCKRVTNSFCINKKCRCMGGDYPDYATGAFCRPSFTMTAPSTVKVCGTPVASAIVSPATTAITFKNPVTDVTCTIVPSALSTTPPSLNGNLVSGTAITILKVDPKTGVISLSAALAAYVAGTGTLTWTCTDQRKVVQIGTSALTVVAGAC